LVLNPNFQGANARFAPTLLTPMPAENKKNTKYRSISYVGHGFAFSLPGEAVSTMGVR